LESSLLNLLEIVLIAVIIHLISSQGGSVTYVPYSQRNNGLTI